MVDNLTKEQRSKCMSRIRSKWTAQEVKIHNYLKGNKIKHKMHPRLIGKPDILLTNTNVVVFLHGCFWHKCPKCFSPPKSNVKFWTKKINGNVQRDKNINEILSKEGYVVLRFWTHEIKEDSAKCFNKIYKAVRKNIL